MEAVRFRGMVRPGDRLVIVTRLLKSPPLIMTCEFQWFVKQNLVCEGHYEGRFPCRWTNYGAASPEQLVKTRVGFSVHGPRRTNTLRRIRKVRQWLRTGCNCSFPEAGTPSNRKWSPLMSWVAAHAAKIDPAVDLSQPPAGVRTACRGPGTPRLFGRAASRWKSRWARARGSFLRNAAAALPEVDFLGIEIAKNTPASPRRR